MKDLFLRLKTWFKGLPWAMMLAAGLVMTLLLSFVIRGDLFWTDWLWFYAFAAAFVVAASPKIKRP
jgi:hypothetical protein